jgi:biopolymer transport protein ExbD
MSEPISSNSEERSRSGARKYKKRSTNIDLTPMVDLGFLLITFFIFTTTMAEPTTMKLRMPHDAIDIKDSMQTPASGAISILMAGDNRLYYYFGMLSNNGAGIVATDYKKIREVIINKKRNTDPQDFMILLKSTNEATYQNTVDMLDEMYINDVKKYALLDFNESVLIPGH